MIGTPGFTEILRVCPHCDVVIGIPGTVCSVKKNRFFFLLKSLCGDRGEIQTCVCGNPTNSASVHLQ